MKNYLKKTSGNIARALLFLCVLLLSPIYVFADFTTQPGSLDNVEKSGGWTPTDAGLVVQLNPNDQFRLSTFIDGEEFFVCDYLEYAGVGNRYKYNQGNGSDNILKLIPRNDDNSYPVGSLWTVQAPLKHKVNGGAEYDIVKGIDGIIYSMWSAAGQTLTTENNDYLIATGALTTSKTAKYTCNVAFAIPTVRSRINMDPKNSLGRGYPFDGQMGVDEKGNVWREVYWFHKSRVNAPYSYATTGLTAFDTSTGKAYQINGKTSHAQSATNKKRMLFRLYIVEEHPFETCPNSYFFAHDEQNYLQFLKFTSLPIDSVRPNVDSTEARKIYTHDVFHCMERVGDTKYYQTEPHQISTKDSSFYYVGKHNNFFANRGTNPPTLGPTAGSFSAFKNIRQLRIRHLENESTPFIAPVGATGRFVVDTTSGAENLGVTFDPVGYFFRTSSGVNVPMVQVDDTTWITATMWHIEGEYMDLSGEVLLYSGTTFSATDPGVPIAGWSQMVPARTIPVYGHPGWTAEGRSGWARIYTNDPSTNGGMVFVLADTDHYIRYHNNGNFGTDIQDQHPLEKSDNVLTIQAARLIDGYAFVGWNTNPDGTGRMYHVGDRVDLDTVPAVDGKHILDLYAQATYTGDINVAISFLKEDGKRYFLSPSGSAPRFGRARHIDDWTNAWQGMGDPYNSDPNYLSTFKLVGKNQGSLPCVECDDDEYVLDPHRSTMHGSVDSLVFYELHQPESMEYPGLLYGDYGEGNILNTFVVNNTWAGLFTSTEGWPSPARACVDSTRIASDYYLTGWPNNVKNWREDPDNPGHALPSELKYIPETNQFDGAAENAGTDFMISGVGVVDEHYVILPDTTDESKLWVDSIVFAWHETNLPAKQVWSKLIGKQLLAQMKLGEDTIYFHPNRNKIIQDDVTALATSRDFRLTHDFEYKHDARVEALHVVRTEDKPTFVENGFQGTVTSGETSPVDVINIDIVDTLRVWLRPTGASKIKQYFGRWSNNAPGVHVLPNGSRYRDIIVKTKTYHHGPVQKTLRLVPTKPSYNFGSLNGVSEDVNFSLELVTWHELLDADNRPLRVDTISIADTTSILDLTSAEFSLLSSDFFTIGTPTRIGVRLTTKVENTTSPNRDTLTVTTNVSLGGVSTPVTVEVPLLQVSTIGYELIWSVKYGEAYYFIMGATDNPSASIRDYNNLRIQTLSINKARLVRNKNELFFGSKEIDGKDDRQHIRPWRWYDTDPNTNQLTLKTEYGINRWFHIADETTPEGSTSDSTALTFIIDTTYTNDNGNYEEIVYLKYGTDKWLGFNGSAITLVNTKEAASKFSWAYMKPEWYIQNNGKYPSENQVDFSYNTNRAASIQTRYQAYLDYSMLLNNQLLHLCKTQETDVKNLINPSQEWKTLFTDSIIRDSRMATWSGLSYSLDTATLTTTITQTCPSPLDIMYNGEKVNIVDTLDFRITLQPEAPEYRFAGNWSSYASIEQAHLKIPLIRRTYHETPFDSVICLVDKDEYNYAFPAFMRSGVRTDSVHTFTLHTERRKGKRVYGINNDLVTQLSEEPVDVTDFMDFTDRNMAEIRLRDEHGNTPTWCRLIDITENTITIKCLSNGLRTPRMAYVDFAYVVVVENKIRYINFRLTVSQASYFQYANNQTLIHSIGASGDPLVDGKQQVHENKRILYYYNPRPYHEADQNVELPLRERGYYGWWRWYREGKDQNGVDVSDTDIPDSVWIMPPRNVSKQGSSYNFPYRIIGDSVKILNPKHGQEGEPDSIMELVTMGRYTVFYNPSKNTCTKDDPSPKTPQVHAPFNKDTVIYAVDISNYYDHLPMSTKVVNQVDTAKLDTMKNIIEPTLSLREIYELHPWTEMAERLEGYKDTIDSPTRNLKYMEDHVVRAPTGTRLLLKTEQRYIYEHLAAQYDKNGNLKREGHSESLLGYYMRDDNWATWADDEDRQDTMIWCGGWDAKCAWYTYNPKTQTYDSCGYTITVDDDFLEVPVKGGISSGNEFDTVYYCLRARSVKTNGTKELDYADDEPEDGDYWFNICRYQIIFHRPEKYGPLMETNVGGVMKAIKTNEEIEENYEILEQLNFDYNKPGSDYRIYPHPLPWGDVSYGYTYPPSAARQNRYHDEKDFPGPGEYALINRIPPYHLDWWRPVEQHGGAENGYMIYCDGMSSSGQVAALSLQTKLCEGQKLYFSGYVGNISAQKNKAKPSFNFAVQGSEDGKVWEDITSFMTGAVDTSDNWYQIFFPIEFTKPYDHFRVRIYNMSSNFDGNDFVIDDMCIFATKPPLIAYQANTKCVEQNETDSIIHVVLRVDYQGFIDDEFNNKPVYYTVEQLSLPDSTLSFVPMIDGYINGDTIHSLDPLKPDTVFGSIRMPARTYDPEDDDSIFINIQQLADTFEVTYKALEKWEKDHEGDKPVLFRQGYVYENLDGDVRPVLYVVHKAKMVPKNKYTVRMATNTAGLMSSECAVTSILPVTSRMKLMLNGQETEDKNVSGICGNVTHDLSLRVRGTLMQDGTAPIDLAGTCVNDWLLYGDTAYASSKERYGYCYSDIVHVVKDILRFEPAKGETNVNQFARTLGAVNKATMGRIKNAAGISLETKEHPYKVLKNLVDNGFLILYQSSLSVTVGYGDSVQYVIFPILGTGTEDLHHQNMDVCPTPLVITLKSKENLDGVPMIIGGLHRDSTQMNNPVIVLADTEVMSSGVRIPVDSIRSLIGVSSVELFATDDPNFREGVHHLEMTPDRPWPGDYAIEEYYRKGDTIILTPSSSNNYAMRQGYNYTFNMVMVNPIGISTDVTTACPIGDVPFTLSYVPDYLRWAPRDAESNQWNNSANWVGISAQNKAIHEEARFAPLPSTKVLIPAMTDGMPYPVLPDASRFEWKDSVQKVGFAYNVCDAIRFLPGAAIGQQQHLLYNDAIIDMRIPNQSWALRAAPVTGMISGDLFMSNADLLNNSDPWMVGEFDSNGRNNTIGNGAFYLSVYNRETTHLGNGQNIKDTTYTASAEWSKVTNGMTLSLPPASGWAVYARTKSGEAADLRLPKNDDVYYYYTKSGEKSGSENELRAKRDDNAGGSGKAGRMAFQPDGASQNYPIASKNAQSIVFGNPTMGYIDIWGFITDNTTYLADEISYLDDKGYHTPVSKATAMDSKDTINELMRYLPPMRAIVIKLQESVPENATVRLDGTRIVTRAVSYVAPSAPSRRSDTGHSKGIMTVTALNSVSPRCVSRLRIGQGYHDEVLQGEDAVLTTYNIDNFHMTNTPTTPFNIYSVDKGFGLSIDLRDKVVNIPVSFYMSDLPYDPVTSLWFTGVNRIDGPLVFYDEFTDTAVPIIDGICIDIETPQENHQTRYYIRRPDYKPENPDNPIATGVDTWGTNSEQAYKYIRNGIVYILRNGHVYTMFGQKIR